MRTQKVELVSFLDNLNSLQVALISVFMITDSWKRSENMDHKLLVPVVWMVKNASIWIDFNPVDNTVGFPDTHLLDSDYLKPITLSAG